MDFGKVSNPELVDFTLPKPREVRLSTSEKPLEIYVGPPIWGNKAWVGKIYPTAAKETEYLYHYCRQFNTIELNVTHYQVPSEATIQRWKEAATPQFKFCPKFPQLISHDRQLIGTESITNEFVTNLMGLEENLGISFLQLGPTFAPKHLPQLERYLKSLPADFPVNVEFRHPDWFKSDEVWAKTVDTLADCGAGLVITDVSGRRDVMHQSLSDNSLQIRFVANDMHPTDFERIHDWLPQLKHWVKQGLHTLYVFLHTTDNLVSPELTNYWIEQLNGTFGTQLTPSFIRPQVVQGSLF